MILLIDTGRRMWYGGWQQHLEVEVNDARKTMGGPATYQALLAGVACRCRPCHF